MTEKDYKPQKSEGKGMIVEKPKKIPVANAPVDNKVINKKDKVELAPIEKKEKKETLEPKGKEIKEEKPEEKKKPIVKNPINTLKGTSTLKGTKKKTEAVVNAKSLPISAKQSIAICKFIKGKKIKDVVEYLEQVAVGKKAMPMKGEIPHRKGKMMSGRFPKNSSLQFIKLLKSLSANANANNLEEPIISEAIANKAQRPYGRFGRVKKKRTHVTIKCKEHHKGVPREISKEMSTRGKKVNK